MTQQQVRMASSAQVKAVLDLCARKNYVTEEDFTAMTSEVISKKIAYLVAFQPPSEGQVKRLKEQLGYIMSGGYMSKEQAFTDAEISRMSGGMSGEMSTTIQAFDDFLREHPECLPVSEKQIDYLVDLHTCLTIESIIKRQTPEGRYLTRKELKEQIPSFFNLKTAKDFIEANSEVYAEFRRTAVPMQTIEAFRRAEKIARGEDLAKNTQDRLASILSRTATPTVEVDPEENSDFTDTELRNMEITVVWEMTNALKNPQPTAE